MPLAELRSQLTELESLVAHIPRCVIGEVLKEATRQMKEERAQLDKQFAAKQKEWDSLKVGLIALKSFLDN